MKIFLLDLWHDLREKRLWPVAAALVLGLVAVPVLLAKPAEDPGPAPVVNEAPAEASAKDALAALAKVKLGEDAGGSSGSTLGVFDPDNPFKPPKGTFKKADADSSGGGAGPGSDQPAGGDTGAPSGGDTSGGTGGGTGTTTGGDTGSTGGDTGGSTGGDTTTSVTYKYVADVTFSANGRRRRIDGLGKLDMLPNQASPLLIFMGVTENAGDAVFLVDSTLQAAGEGRCKPSAEDCAFLYLGAGAEHEFTNDDGDSYRLRVDEIRKVKLDTSAASSRNKDDEGETASASLGSTQGRRFVPPIIADLVTVSSKAPAESTSDQDHR